ncbi:MAG: NADH-dependent phenylglyoxylate dehydrogenase subunit beta [Promethearchaeota archaeon]|nr:MAG: NADH-dependent phenylglyoxylate dehydrogenase subunit beta [Candidatus Lokiarchaeota archaeon]
MKKKVLVFEPKKCIGCRLCEGYCAMTHYGVNNPSKSRIRIIRNHKKQIDIAIYCHQCINPPCVEACKFNALSVDSETGAISVEEENCTACRMCVEKCPYAVPSIHPDNNIIMICDLCGGEPKCVEICPENAIQYLEIHKADNIYKSIYTKQAAENLTYREEGK